MRVLVAEDEKLLCLSLCDSLRDEGYEVACVGDGQKAWQAVREAPPHLLVADVRMPGMDGMELLRRVREDFPETAVLLMTTFASVKDAVLALQSGAADYLVKPFEMAEFLERVRRVAEVITLRGEKRRLLDQLERVTRGSLFLGSSPAMRRFWASADRVAPLDVDILLEGETGTGKEVVARAIHEASPRAGKPFVPVSCAVLSGSLLENELFGHEKGAFTGADRAAAGRFEAASGGTLFLDDVDDIPPEVQAKILRVLQERTVERLGSIRSVPVDFRLISATKRDLGREVEAGCFRRDLYYRLHVVHLHLPPLRERREDILPLAGFFLRQFAGGREENLLSLDPGAARLLLAHPWPGNVRELKHAIQAAAALCEGPVILPENLPAEIRVSAGAGEGSTPPWWEPPGGAVHLDTVLAETERRLLRWALEEAKGSQSRAAALLGIPRSTFQYRWRKSGGGGRPAGERDNCPKVGGPDGAPE
ncbi:MAG: sigma-54-dependent transcriptional regulator [Acidobacteriota bacterium]